MIYVFKDVTVLSDKVFQAIQAPFLMDLKRKSDQAQQDAQTEILLRRAACSRVVEEDRISKELTLGVQQTQLHEAQAEDAKAQVLREADVQRAKDDCTKRDRRNEAAN